MPRATVFLAFLITAPLSACRDSAFLKAEKTGTIDAYKRFIDAHPLDENVEIAQERLADLELTEAKRVHTVVAYKRYLEEHPDGERANVARALLEGLRFNAAKQRSTTLAWRQFVK